MLINVNEGKSFSENHEIGDITDSGAYFQDVLSDKTLNIVVYPAIIVEAFGQQQQRIFYFIFIQSIAFNFNHTPVFKRSISDHRMGIIFHAPKWYKISRNKEHFL